MALNSTHPLYDGLYEDWVLMRDCYAGERVVKAKGTTYLPATPGQILDGLKTDQVGWKAYTAYNMRAVFHDYVSDAVEFYIGLLHSKPTTFELPDGMKGLMDKATNHGETLHTLYRRITEEQLVTGRLGLLLDFPKDPDPTAPLPYISMYIAESLKNWDDSDNKEDVNSLNLVVLDESSYERQTDFNWKLMEKYRVLMLQAAAVPATTEPEQAAPAPDPNAPTIYHAGVFYVRDGNTVKPEEMTTPMFRGQTIDKIPFVFINSKDIVSAPDNPPMLGLGRLSMTIYRGEADFRNQLFLQGQDTLITIGGLLTPDGGDDGDGVRVGAGARIDLNLGGDAKYIGVSATGLPEVAKAVQADKDRASIKAGSLANKNTGQKESGESLRIRLGSQTATLTQIALASAAGLQQVLRIAAEWMGQDPLKVNVIPNLEFDDPKFDGKDLVDLMTARTMGAPISLESIHNRMVERGLTELEFEEEMDKIAEEDAGAAERNAELGLDPTGQVIPDPALVTPENPTGDPAKDPKKKGAAGRGKDPASA